MNRVLIRKRNVADKIATSIRTVDRLATADPSFPKPIRISPGRVAWFEGEIDAWVDQQRDAVISRFRGSEHG